MIFKSLDHSTNHCLHLKLTVKDGSCQRKHPDGQRSKGSHRGYEGHGDGEVQGATEDVGPHVGAATARGTASQEESEPH